MKDVDEATWWSVNFIITSEFKNSSFAFGYPAECRSCKGVLGTDRSKLNFDINYYIPRLARLGWTPDAGSPKVPGTWDIFDLIELCYKSISKLTSGRPCGRSNCLEGGFSPILELDRDAGQKSFRRDINRIFEREKIAFELNEEGMITRIGAPIISDAIHYATFHTGDDDLDSMLETARSKFISRDPAERNEALKDLWDAWERLKTIENPSDKKDSTAILLDQVADGELRQSLEKETRELTDIGNKFQIRHSEVDQVPLTESHHVDYLFHRMFSLVHMLLVTTGRGK